MIVPGYGHTNVSVDRVVFLLGWALPLFYEASGELLGGNFCFASYKSIYGD